jgi:Holliday junction resolvasome RuvABC endonuclease subunit
MAIDPSLTCSGWALFSIPQEEVLAVGKIKADPPIVPMAERLRKLQTTIARLFSDLTLGGADVLVCEAPTTMKDPNNTIKVEQVRGLFESLGRSRGVVVPGRVNPRSVQYEVMGLKGKQLTRTEVKASAVRTVHYLYAPALQRLGFDSSEGGLGKHQDVVDAILIGRFAILKIRGALEGRQALEEVFDVQKKQSRRSWRVRACTG